MGQGSVSQDGKSGKWRARYYGDDGKQHSKSFRTKTEAREFLSVMHADRLRGTWLDPSGAKTPFDEWALEWLKGKHGLGSAARIRDESLLRNHVIGTPQYPWGFGSTPIGQIRAVDVRRWINDLVGAGYMPRTIRSIHRIFASVMAAAVAAKMIPDAPIGRGVVELPAIERRRERFLFTHEAERLVSCIDPFFRPLVYTALYTGCRWQELAGLRRMNLDLDKAQLHVRSVVEKGNPELKEVPKSQAGRRTIKLNPRLVLILRKHLQDAPPGEMVFTGPSGLRLEDSNFAQRYWQPAVRRAGLEPLTFHDLRHTHVSWLIEWGWQEVKIVRRLGWTDGVMLHRVYGHLFPNAEDELVEMFDRHMTEAEEISQSAKIVSLNA